MLHPSELRPGERQSVFRLRLHAFGEMREVFANVVVHELFLRWNQRAPLLRVPLVALKLAIVAAFFLLLLRERRGTGRRGRAWIIGQ